MTERSTRHHSAETLGASLSGAADALTVDLTSDLGVLTAAEPHALDRIVAELASFDLVEDLQHDARRPFAVWKAAASGRQDEGSHALLKVAKNDTDEALNGLQAEIGTYLYLIPAVTAELSPSTAAKVRFPLLQQIYRLDSVTRAIGLEYLEGKVLGEHLRSEPGAIAADWLLASPRRPRALVK